MAAVPQNIPPPFDLRLIVVRHAERLDTVYGDGWYSSIFGNNTTAPVQLYQDSRLPIGLPKRQWTMHYLLDPPITRDGQQKSLLYGRQLLSSIGPVDYCYVSPSTRSVLTADAILQGMNRRQAVPLRIDSLLIEPISWNATLRAFRSSAYCMPTTDWVNAGYNVDQTYQSAVSTAPATNNNESEYYARSKGFLRSLEQAVSYAASQGHARPRTILIVGHSPSTAVFPMIVNNEPLNLPVLYQKCANSKFLDTVILERIGGTQQWRQTSVFQPPLQ